MAVPTICQCGARIQAKDELAGKTVRCPTCHQPLTIPSGAAPADKASPIGQLTVACRCGATYHVASNLVGKRVRCGKCKQGFVVEEPAVDPLSAPQPFDPLFADNDAFPAADPFAAANPLAGNTPLHPGVQPLFPMMPNASSMGKAAAPPASSDNKVKVLLLVGGVGLGAVVLIVLAFALLSDGNGYKTPEAAYAAFQTAVEKQDWGALYDLMSVDSQQVLAGMCAIRIVFNPEKQSSLYELKTKYQIDPGLTIAGGQINPNTPDLFEHIGPDSMKKVGGKLPDSRALVIETLRQMEAQRQRTAEGKGPRLSHPFTSDRCGPLTDLQRQSNEAIGKVGKRTIRFVRNSRSSWKVELLRS